MPTFLDPIGGTMFVTWNEFGARWPCSTHHHCGNRRCSETWPIFLWVRRGNGRWISPILLHGLLRRPCRHRHRIRVFVSAFLLAKKVNLFFAEVDASLCVTHLRNQKGVLSFGSFLPKDALNVWGFWPKNKVERCWQILLLILLLLVAYGSGTYRGKNQQLARGNSL